jgi:adenine-specific DNA-methyltransferase
MNEMKTSSGDVSEQFFSDFPEKEYIRNKTKEDVRKLGQYFTPYSVARFMAEWISQSPNLNHVLDPAVGLGVFFRALIEVNPNFSGKLCGYDIDNLTLDKLTILFDRHTKINTQFLNQNFLYAENNTLYDGILCNPPYIRYKSIPERDKLIKKFEQESTVSISRLSNIYSFFIIRCALSLAPQGRAAILVPTDFLYSDFGIPLKEFLLERMLLKHIIQFDPNNGLFENSVTTSCILLLQNNDASQSVSFFSMRDISDLGKLSKDFDNLKNSTVPLSIITPTSISPQEKWSKYFFNSSKHLNYRHLIPFSRVARVVRGIASGDNNYFTFTRKKIDQYQIPSSCLLPCVTKASQINHSLFFNEDFVTLEKLGKAVYLFNANQEPDHPAVQSYLHFGEQNGSNKRFLTRNRTPWYRLENRPPAPILATTFNRKALRFVRNEAGVRNLTCFHSIYLREDFTHQVDLLMSYLITPLALSLIYLNRREYGDGLIKYEPNDLNSALIADLDSIPQSVETKILQIYNEYRQSCLVREPENSLITLLNNTYSEWLK